MVSIFREGTAFDELFNNFSITSFLPNRLTIKCMRNISSGLVNWVLYSMIFVFSQWSFPSNYCSTFFLLLQYIQLLAGEKRHKLLPPATKLGQSNIFSSVCQEFCPQLVVAAETHTVGKRAVRILLECFLVKVDLIA